MSRFSWSKLIQPQTRILLHTITTLILIAVFQGKSISADESATNAPKSRVPNIVVILADDMGYADAGFMGGKEIATPALDKLAARGAVLESHYVQPVCSPTRSCLMTGRYTAHTGVYNVVRPGAKWGLPLAERTLATALREAGYETAIVGKWHLGEFEEAYRPTRRGFDHQYGNWFGALDYFTHVRDGVADWHRDDKPCHDKGYTTHLNADEACRLIREKKEKPLFLYVPFNAVHGPLQSPPEYRKPYEALPERRRAYAGVLAAMDEAIGKIVAALEEKKILDNTLIVFSSDNGGPSPGVVTSNGPLRAGKATIYEGGVRACAFASWPGHIPAGRIREPMHMIDWYPTLITLAGGSLEQKLPLDGKNIWPVLTQGAKSPHEAIYLCGNSPNKVAVRQGDWKLVIDNGGDDAEEGEDTPLRKAKAKANAPVVPLALYNLAEDLGEKNDVSAANPEKVKELQLKIDEFKKTCVPPGAPPITASK